MNVENIGDLILSANGTFSSQNHRTKNGQKETLELIFCLLFHFIYFK